MFRYFTHMFMQEWGMQRQVQVSILGACICAVLSVVLQGAARWTLLSICGVLAVWAMVLLVTKPKEDKTPPPQLPQPMNQKQEMNNSGNANLKDIGNVTQNFYGTPPPSPVPVARPVVRSEEDDLPHLEYVDANEIFLYADNLWYGEIANGTHIALVATFENPSKGKHAKNIDAEDVVAKLKYKNSSGKSLNVTSSWVGNMIQGTRINAGGTQRLIVAFRDKPGTNICAVPCYNAHGPQRHSIRAYINSLERMKFPVPQEIMQDCSEIEISLIGNDDHTLFKHTFGFEVLKDGTMNLTKK